MSKYVLAYLLPLVLALSPIHVQAQETGLRQSMALGYWPAAVSFMGPGGTIDWTSSFLTLDYWAQSERSPYGVRLQYGIGAESGWSAPMASGTDAMWGIDVTFGTTFGAEGPSAGVRGSLGYGSMKWDNTDTGGLQLVQTTNAFRVGADLTFGQSNWSVNVGGRWYPSANTTVHSPALASTDSATGSALEYSATIRYGGLFWFVELGYRGTSVSYGTLSGGVLAGGCPCSTGWNGFLINLGSSF
ncbi:MAG: hypothetical protein ACRD1T_24560 [Acidimicrobiia bacterium]